MTTTAARSGRQKRSLATRGRIITAATRLFERDGYLETTMSAIAAEAGVVVQTLYLAFGSKGSILAAARDAAITPDPHGEPVLQQSWTDDVRAETDGARALTLFLQNALGIVERVSPIYAVIQAAAADAEVAELLDATRKQRFETLKALTDALAAKAGFTTAMPAERAADLVYMVVSEEQYRLLVIDRGWDAEEWRAWCVRILLAELFPVRRGDAS